MTHICPHCGEEFAAPIIFDSLGWHTSCPRCEGSFDVDPDPATPGERYRSAKQKATLAPAQGSYNTGYLCGYADALRELFDIQYYCIRCGDPDATAWQWLTPNEAENHRKAGYTVTLL